MLILKYIRFEIRRIIIFSIGFLPVAILILFGVIIPLFGLEVTGITVQSVIIDLFLFFVYWPIFIILPMYLIAFTRFPTYHNYKREYYYRKLFKLKQITLDNITKIEEVQREFGVFGGRYYGPGFNYYFKGESLPVRFVIEKYKHNLFDYPRFAKEVIAKFPPDDFPPPEKKGSGGNL